MIPISFTESLGEGGDSMLRIAMISPGLYSVPPVLGTSVEHDIEMVSKELAFEHHVVVYTRTDPKYPRSTKHGNLEYKRIQFKNWKQYLKEVSHDLEKLNPDVIQVENRPIYAYYLQKLFPNKPIILNMHSMVFLSPKHISSVKLRKVFKSIDAVITNSRYLEKIIEAQDRSLEGKVFGVHLGIDPSPYLAAAKDNKRILALKSKLRINKSDKIVMYAGRMIKEKGIHHLVNAFPKVLAKMENTKLLLVGSAFYGRNDLTPYTKQLLTKINSFKQHVIPTKFVPPEHMPHLYQLADIVVTPSVWAEPFCRVNLEAMSAGIPVITTKRGGIPEVVINNETGYVLPLKRIKRELPEKIIQLLEDDQLRKEMGVKGVKRAEELTWKKTADEYLQIYVQSMERRNKPSLIGELLN